MPTARILLVEDEGIIAEDIQMSLQDFGYEVCGIVATGEDAVLKTNELRPDLVLMDVVLQGHMDGIEAANQINTSLKIPIIYLTAYADDKMLERAKITEPFGYLIKPFRDRELHSTIEMALFKHEFDIKLKESQEWLSVTLHSVADALIATDCDGLVKFMNPVAEFLTGWASVEAKARPLESVFSITDAKTGAEIGGFARRIIDGPDAVLSLENIILTLKDGRKLHLEANGSPIRDHEGRVIGIVLVFRDISARKQAEAQVRLLSEAVQQSSEGVVVLDLHRKLIFVNKAFAEMHGRNAEDMLNKPIESFHSPEHLPKVYEALAGVLAKGTFSGEVWHSRKDGSVFPGLMHNSVLKDKDSSVVGIIGTLQDITDIKATEHALRASHEALAAYSASLEAKVAERTRDLEKSRGELKRYSESLEKTNEALKVIIEGVEEQKKDVEKKISHNLNLTVRPILDQLKSQEVPETVSFLIKSLEFNLTNMFSSFGFNIIKDGHLLTPKEIRICEMIRSGLSSKQIAKVMTISPQTVLVHRKNIRKKLELGKSRQNLASFLKANL
jgi:PAS domain S-box-containing protein